MGTNLFPTRSYFLFSFFWAFVPQFCFEQHPFDTCTLPFSPQVGGLRCSHDVLYSLFFFFRSRLVFRHEPFNTRVFHLIFDFDILTCIFLLVWYGVLGFHSYVGAFQSMEPLCN